MLLIYNVGHSMINNLNKYILYLTYIPSFKLKNVDNITK